MKKNWIVTATIVVPVLACILAPWNTALGQTEQSGHVLTVKKDVYLFRAGQQSAARARDPLYLEDAVATDQDSRAKLFFRDDSVLNLGERSRVEVEQYLYSTTTDRSRAVYNLVEGSLKVVVGRSDLEIHTPTAVAAARGTRFLVALRGTGDEIETLILVLEGEVAVRSITEQILKVVTLRQGQMTTVPLRKPPAPPTQTPPHLLDQYRTGTLAIGEVFRDRLDALPRPGDASSEESATAAGEPRADDRRDRDTGSEPKPGVWDAMKNLGQPPIAQEPSRALGSDNTDVNVNVDFPEGR
jgi:hypothetical protein